jgi:hypothetical protein
VKRDMALQTLSQGDLFLHEIANNVYYEFTETKEFYDKYELYEEFLNWCAKCHMTPKYKSLQSFLNYSNRFIPSKRIRKDGKKITVYKLLQCEDPCNLKIEEEDEEEYLPQF